MRTYAAQSAEAVDADARALQVGPLDAARVADYDVLDVALAVYERADLPAGLVRKLRELPRELGRDYLLRGDSARMELLDAPELVRLQSLSVAVYGANR